MRHRVFGYRLGRNAAHRNSLRRNLMNALLGSTDGRITTTEAKARAVRGEVERIITIAKRGNGAGVPVEKMNALRLVIQRLNDKDIARKVMDDWAVRYAKRPGGYTRLLKLGQRAGDAAEMVVLELVEE